MNEEIYKQNILDHYKYPHHKGVLDLCNVHANATNRNCGDELTLYLNIKDKKIIGATFDGDGCAISIAGASMLMDRLAGMSLEAARTLTEADIFALFGVPIGPARATCALLAYSALQEALQKYA